MILIYVADFRVINYNPFLFYGHCPLLC